MPTALIYLPKTARSGDIVTLKAILSHPMETGYRREIDGRPIPRNIVRRFSCFYDGAEVFSAELHPAIAANPFLAFPLVARRTGPVELRWAGDNGFEHRETAMLVVAG